MDEIIEIGITNNQLQIKILAESDEIKTYTGLRLYDILPDIIDEHGIDTANEVSHKYSANPDLRADVRFIRGRYL